MRYIYEATSWPKFKTLTILSVVYDVKQQEFLYIVLEVQNGTTL